MCGISRRPRRIDFEQLRGQGEAVAAGDQHVPDLRGAAQVVELRLVLLAVEVLGRVADDPRPGAVAAVARALGRHEHQHPVRVAMDEAGDRRVAVLGQRVLHHRGERLLLAAERDHLAPDRVGRVLRIDEADEVGRDVDPELVGRAQAGPLLLGQLEDLLDLLEVVDPVAELPAPVVPLLVRDVGPQRSATADRGPAVRADRQGGIAAIDERRLAGRRQGRLVGDRRLDLLGVHAASWSVIRSGRPVRLVAREAFRRIKSMQTGCRSIIRQRRYGVQPPGGPGGAEDGRAGAGRGGVSAGRGGVSAGRAQSPMTAQRKPIMMKKPLNIAMSASAP